MKRISLKVCCGTYCHIMGGAELQLLNETISQDLMQYIDFSYSTCLGFCKEGYGKAPFVEIDGKPMAEATIQKITGYLTELLEQQNHGHK